MATSVLNHKFEVAERDNGKRLDIYLSEQIGRFSRSYLKKFITSEQVSVNGAVQFHAQYKVKSGDLIQLNLPLSDQRRTDVVAPTAGELDIVYEDESVLALNKPVGVVVHPAAGHYTDTLANRVKFYLAQKGENNWGAARAGLVHRLDAPTSGLIIFAKSPESLSFLSEQFAARKVKKTYLAVVAGEAPREFTVDKPLGRDLRNRKKISSRTRKPRRAVTHFKLLATSSDSKYSLLQANPVTGRTHQIRVHLREQGYPIVGDSTYGGPKAGRMLLHSFRLELRLPTQGLDEDSGATGPSAIAKLGKTAVLSAQPDGSFWQELADLGFASESVRMKVK